MRRAGSPFARFQLSYVLRAAKVILHAASLTRNVRPLTIMFVYRPPKGSCWGHSIGRTQTEAMPKLDTFLDVFFQRVEQQSPTTLVLAWKDSVLPKVEWPEAFQ